MFRHHLLKTRVTVFTLAIFVASIWALEFYASRMLRQDMERMLGEQQSAAVSYMAAGVNRALEERIEALQLIAKAIPPTLLRNPSALQTFLEQRFVLHSNFNAGVFALSQKGTVVADVPLKAGRIGINLMDRDYVISVFNKGKSVVGPPVIGKKSQVPVFVIVAPILNAQGKTIGALAGVTNLGQPNFLDLLTQSRQGKNGYYLLEEPKSRTIITGTDKRRVMQPLPAPGINPLIDRHVQGFDDTGVTSNPLGDEVLASAKRVPAADWFIVGALPTTEAFAPIRAMQQRMLLAAILLTLLAGGLVWWMLRRQLNPLLIAANTLSERSDSNLPLQPLPISQQDEIGILIGGFNRLLSTLKEREEALHIAATAFEAQEGIVITDVHDVILRTNHAFTEITGYRPEDAIGQKMNFLKSSRHDASFYAEMWQAILRDGAWQGEIWNRTKSGEIRPHWLTVSAVKENDVTTHYVGTYTDITERKAAEEKLRESDLRWKFAIEGSGDGVWDTNIQTGHSQYSKRWKEMLGYTDEDILPTRDEWLKLIHPEDQSHVATSMQAYLEGKTPSYAVEYRLRCKDNSYKWILGRGIVVSRSDDGKPLRMIGTHTDITDRKLHEQQLEHIAHYDALTSLPNRVLLADRLHQGMIQAQRRGQRLAVAYLDLDGFKAINDHHGHETGDQLLITVATRMKQALRESDTLARLGGDEFVAVLTDLADIEASVPMLTRLLSAAAEPVHIGNLVLQVSASLGVTFYPQSSEVDADQLLRQSDQAMYQAKLAGKNRYYVFDSEQDSSIRGHHESLERIRRALSAQEFVLHYQPKVNMRTGAVTGAEALIRWQHPEKGLLPPGVFLPVIEDHLLAIEVGEWVISTALTQMEIWHAVGLDIPVSVNVSARQLQELNFVDRLSATLSQHPNIRAGCLELEVLETSALEDMAHISKLIEGCRGLGVKFSLDDFGTGYSSLTYLKRLPVTTLKIDQSFVRDMLEDPDDLAILQGILGLATAFNRDVIAEGVETMEHGAMLLQLGCDHVQGYGIARPMPASEMPAWAAAWRPDAAWVDLYRIRRDDLALLFAGVEHRAWIASLEIFLKGDGKELPPLNQHECRFGKWLHNDGISRYQTHPSFQGIAKLHQQVHVLATELLKLHLHGQQTSALARLPELHILRDSLLELLKKLLQSKDH